jgi:hypothetical protein
MAGRLRDIAAAVLAAAAALIAGLAAQPAAAQAPVRLPSVERTYPAGPTAGAAVYLPETGPAVQLTALPPQFAEPIILPDERLFEDKSPEQRDGIFQKLDFSATWLAKPAADDLGQWDFGIYAVYGFPLCTRESPLLVTPSFQTTLFDGPNTPDLPARVYDAEIQFRHLRKLTQRIAMDVAVSPGMHTDFEIDNGNAFRITGRGLAIYEWSDDTKLLLGAAYLDRYDVSILPIGGIIYVPNDDWRFEIVAPTPRIAYRMCNFGAVCDYYDPCAAPHKGNEVWVYTAGEFGGGLWSIRRESGENDLVAIRDYRVRLGVEFKSLDCISSRLEVGYVFGRVVEYRSATPDYDPGDTVMLRYGASY